MLSDLAKHYLDRIRNFSSKLEEVNSICNKKWINDDITGVHCAYRFQTDGRLIVSMNGEGQIWKYEFIQPNSLVITDSQNKISVLNHACLFDGILTLEKEGTGQFILFYDDEKVTDGNVELYIKSQILNELQVTHITVNSESFYIGNNGLYIGSIILQEDLQPIAPSFKKIGDLIYKINSQSMITHSYGIVVLKSKEKLLNFLVNYNGIISENDLVLFDDLTTKPNGIFQIENHQKIKAIRIIQGRVREIAFHPKETQPIANYLQPIANYLFPVLMILVALTLLIVLLIINNKHSQ
jgi:hypothetical protein